MNPARTSEHRPFRAAAIALLFATGLAACGGGSSTGPNPFVPAPVACDSASASSADGFTIGMCASTATSVFVDVGSAVQIPLPTDSYILTLNFPAALDANDSSTPFTAANLTATGWDRNVLGALRGVSYEDPLNATLTAPYTALTDFHSPAPYLYSSAPWTPPQLEYVRFGTWEKVPTSTEGFVGPWYEGFSATTTVVNFWPNGEAANRLYRGYVVGVIGPDEDGSTYLTRLRSFSAPVEIEVDGNGRIVRAGFGTVVMPYYDSNSQLKFEPLPIDAVRLRQNATDTPGGLLTGPVESAEGPDADLVDGRFEAKYFGVSGDYSYELAGRFRFRTSNGLIAIGSFGAQFVPPPPG
jgi:hypothetical protein